MSIASIMKLFVRRSALPTCLLLLAAAVAVASAPPPEGRKVTAKCSADGALSIEEVLFLLREQPEMARIAESEPGYDLSVVNRTKVQCPDEEPFWVMPLKCFVEVPDHMRPIVGITGYAQKESIDLQVGLGYLVEVHPDIVDSFRVTCGKKVRVLQPVKQCIMRHLIRARKWEFSSHYVASMLRTTHFAAQRDELPPGIRSVDCQHKTPLFYVARHDEVSEDPENNEGSCTAFGRPVTQELLDMLRRNAMYVFYEQKEQPRDSYMVDKMTQVKCPSKDPFWIVKYKCSFVSPMNMVPIMGGPKGQVSIDEVKGSAKKGLLEFVDENDEDSVNVKCGQKTFNVRPKKTCKVLEEGATEPKEVPAVKISELLRTTHYKLEYYESHYMATEVECTDSPRFSIRERKGRGNVRGFLDQSSTSNTSETESETQAVNESHAQSGNGKICEVFEKETHVDTKPASNVSLEKVNLTSETQTVDESHAQSGNGEIWDTSEEVMQVPIKPPSILSLEKKDLTSETQTVDESDDEEDENEKAFERFLLPGYLAKMEEFERLHTTHGSSQHRPVDVMESADELFARMVEDHKEKMALLKEIQAFHQEQDF